MTIALVLFALAAVGGAILAVQRLSGKELPSFALALVHGAAAAAGLVALLLLVVGGTASGGLKLALTLFLVAALGGFVLFFQHLQKKALPVKLMVLHALLAVVGFVILVAGALQ